MPMFNNFPATYQTQYYPQMQMPQTQQMPMNNNSIIWVTGEAGAKSYLVAPNTTVQLWDSEAQIIYLKSADASGMPSIKTLDYTIRAENQPISGVSLDDNKFILREEFNVLKGELEALQSEIKRLKPRNNNNNNKKEEKNYE